MLKCRNGDDWDAGDADVLIKGRRMLGVLEMGCGDEREMIKCRDGDERDAGVCKDRGMKKRRRKMTCMSLK